MILKTKDNGGNMTKKFSSIGLRFCLIATLSLASIGVAVPGEQPQYGGKLTYVDWFSNVDPGNPDIGECREFVQDIRSIYPNMLFAYNCSPSFNWKAKLSDKEIRTFKDELGDLDVKYQFITLAGFHSLNYGMFELSEKYRDTGMSGFVELQEKEFAAQERGFTAVKHQREVGASYFDQIGQLCTGSSDLSAIKGSTEEEQF